MKLQLRQLASHLEKQFLPLYLISGAELALVDEAKMILTEAAQKKGFSERIVIYDETPANFERFESIIDHFSLFSTPQLIEIQNPSAKVDEASLAILKKYLTNPSPDQRVILITGKLTSAQQKTRWYQLIEERGAAITIWPLTANELQTWLMKKLEQYSLAMTADALRKLSERTEGNLSAALQIIQQLALLYPQQKIDADALKTLTDQAHFTVYDLANAALLGDIQRGLRILQNLQVTHTEPSSILWALLHELKTVYALCIEQQHQSLDALLAKQWSSKQPLLKKALTRLSEKKIAEIFRIGLECDEIIKGARNGDIWIELQNLVIKIAQ